MLTIERLAADAYRFRDIAIGAQILDLVEERFRACKAEHFLATGLPLPGRPAEPLVLRASWGDLKGERPAGSHLDPDDPLLQPHIPACQPIRLGSESPHAAVLAKSPLIDMIGGLADLDMLLVPVNAFAPYQAHIVAAGRPLLLSDESLAALSHFCDCAFAQLIAIGHLKPDRPGDLSARERSVVGLSALGQTAGEIAAALGISQRTVHAHLQNASEKLRAGNKTRTVVEALRYAQISL